MKNENIEPHEMGLYLEAETRAALDHDISLKKINNPRAMKKIDDVEEILMKKR